MVIIPSLVRVLPDKGNSCNSSPALISGPTGTPSAGVRAISVWPERGHCAEETDTPLAVALSLEKKVLPFTETSKILQLYGLKVLVSWKYKEM